MKGDLDGHSSLIARNRDELEVLKHKGDRNYYEFTLAKGQKKPVGTISLELKKADQKKSRFTISVFADDNQYDKKRPLRERAAPVLCRQGPSPLRNRGELGPVEEHNLRLPIHAEGCSCSA